MKWKQQLAVASKPVSGDVDSEGGGSGDLSGIMSNARENSESVAPVAVNPSKRNWNEIEQSVLAEMDQASAKRVAVKDDNEIEIDI